MEQNKKVNANSLIILFTIIIVFMLLAISVKIITELN